MSDPVSIAQRLDLRGGRGRDLARRVRGQVFGVVWLVFLSAPVAEALALYPGTWERIGIITLTVLFCAAYIALMAVGVRARPRWFGVGTLATLSVLAVIFCVLVESGLFTFVYLSAAGTIVLPTRRVVLWVGFLVGLTVVLPMVVPGWEVDPTGTLAVMLSAVASFGFVQLLRRNWELRQAHDEIARLAVADERLRFSRDLHDLLGHSLTVITVKAELAGRLLDRAPDRAAAEIQDVERLAREALSDVRATVEGYRATSLAAEISQARRSLEAAGIAAVLPSSADDVEGMRREVFGWVVREGVTNVVRHSGARTCEVRLTATSVEVLDDGVAGGADERRADRARPGRIGEGCTGQEPAEVRPPERTGHGLAGLGERVREVGGTLRAGRRPEGGFRLYAEVGVAAAEPPRTQVPAPEALA